MGSAQEGRGTVPPALGRGRGGRGLSSTFQHHQRGADAPNHKSKRRGRKRQKPSHFPGSESCRPIDHRFSPRRDQDPEGDAGGYGRGLGPEAYQGFRTHASLSSEGGGSHRSHSGT
eukprot:660592-Pleurochrysis_carterae.AAC.2